MRRITAMEMVSLDGVMQGPVLPDEDTRDGFTAGGWTMPYGDETVERAMTLGAPEDNALLFGRRTYQSFADYWPKQGDNPATTFLNAVHKYVYSNTLREPLPWERSTLLTGSLAAAIGDLRTTSGPDLTIYGSGELVRALLTLGLIDSLMLLIHPLTLGTGRQLFDGDDVSRKLRLATSESSTTGVIIATYRVDAASA